MIIESIISSVDKSGLVNFSPFGIKKESNYVYISPYIPSKTLQNIKETKVAVVNYVNDAEVFVNCILGKKKNFKKTNCKSICCFYLDDCLSFDELKVVDFIDDKTRPTFKCKIVYSQINKSFKGLNRANNAIIEACILATRTNILKKEKILKELEYLSIAVSKTSGIKEQKAWNIINKYIKERI